ncbi:MAG: DUF559 domain-containing protein [Propionibacteriaceae bacterium]|nr:DUF559 domain-containing protein [Propionibacteriaceae bacterium]
MSSLADYLPEGVMSARLAPETARSLNSRAFRGQVTRILPGVYGLPEVAASVEGRLKAIGLYGPDLVVTRKAAAALTWWDDLELPDVWELACPRDINPGYGVSVEQRLVAKHLTTKVLGASVTIPELSVLDLIPELDDDVVYEALRRRKVTIGALERALRDTPRRRGNARRKEILKACRAAPWSHLETRGHLSLRDIGLTDWIANYRVNVNGSVYYLDAAFKREKVAVEFDGFQFHGGRDSFHADRKRDVDLASIGWLPLRFTDQTLDSLKALPRILAERRRLLNPEH